MTINFPSSPSNNQLFVAEGKAMRYVASKSKWKQVSTLSSSQITDLEARTVGVSSMSISGNTLVIQKDDSSYANVSLASFAGNKLTSYANASILPLSDLVSGTQVYVEDTDSLYITDGSGWYKIATVNLSPSLTLGVESISLTSGGSVDINYTVNEPEDTPYTISASSTSNATITVYQANNTITFDTPVAATTETITITATDGVNSVGDTLTMTISLGPDWSTLSQTTKITASDASNNDFFGNVVDIDGDYAVVGARSNKAAYIYYYNGSTWSEQQKIQETTFGSNFGHAVSISGDTVLIGSHNEDVLSPDGTKAYVYTRANYNLASASYASKSYSFASVDNGPSGFAFNNDGTKLFFVGWQYTSAGNAGGCYQYSLSTAYDVSTATYDNVSLDLSGQCSQPMGMNFSSDGTKLFVVDLLAGDIVFQYNLSTAFDLSTGSYSNNSLDVSSYATYVAGIDFKPDGTKMYIVGHLTDVIHTWNLSSAWDLSTASYASETFSVATQDDNPTGFTFNSTGTKMYMVGYTNYDIHQYSLSTAWDVSSASYDSVSFDVSSQEGSQPRQIRFNSDGSKLWLIGSVSDSIFEYSTATWSLQQKVDPSQAEQSDYFGYQKTMKLDKSNNNQFIAGAFGEDETNSNEGAVYIFNRSGSTWTETQRIVDSDKASGSNFGIGAAIAGDYAIFGGNTSCYVYYKSGGTWSRQQKISNPYEAGNGHSGPTNAINFAADGEMSINDAGDTIAVGARGQFNLPGYVFIFTRSGTTWSLEQAIYPSDSANEDFFGWSCQLDSTGDNLVVGAKTAGTGGKAYVFTRSSSPAGYDIANASHSTFANIGAHGQSLTDHACLDFSSDGTKMYVGGFSGDLILQYNLTTAFDVSTASYVSGSNLDVSNETTYPTGIRFKPDGTKLYVVNATLIDGGTETIFQYGLSTPWDLSTASYDSVSVDLRTYGTRVNAIEFKPDGTKMFIAGGDFSGSPSDRVDEFSLSTAWDLSTLSHNNAFDVGSQEGFPTGITFNDDGTEMFISGYVSKNIIKYNLTSAYDTSTASYSNESLSVSTQTGQPRNIVFNNDGTKLFLIETDNERVQVYNTQSPTWTQQQNITASDVASNWEFGEGVGLSAEDGRVIVGARQYSSSASGQGAAYIFDV